MPPRSSVSFTHRRFARAGSLLGALSLVATHLLWPAGVARAAAPLANPDLPITEVQNAVNSQTVSFPNTVAGQRFAAWVAAFNSGDATKIRAFHSAPGVPDRLEDRVMGDLQGYRETGGIDIFRVTPDGPFRLTAIGRSRLSELWAELSFRVDSEAPHQVIGIGVAPQPAPAELRSSQPLSVAEVGQQVQEYLTRLEGADTFSGTVLVARDGVPIFSGAYGMADKDAQLPNRLDTKFNLGSMNKMFTAVAIAQLAELGKLSFHDPIGKYLPEYPNKEVAEKVTVHHLLTHTSGLGDYFGPTFFAGGKDTVDTVADYFPFFVDRPLRFEPGAGWAYSNAGFVVLGAIVEQVSGQSYFDYVREHIYAPAGMTDTDAYRRDANVPNLASGYTSGRPGEEAGERRINTDTLPIKGGPAGGGYSTVEDLHRFAGALLSHRLLSPEFTEILLAPKANAGPGRSYAYGIQHEGTEET
ncbi:MAG TPA: serine hydrolase domain-containing protein, partial [Chloroflexota bacterium]|nr:serine hydrolase domain-containing protein [Chloroflexota bacterium]